jgi:hypothetical protein
LVASFSISDNSSIYIIHMHIILSRRDPLILIIPRKTVKSNEHYEKVL